MTKHGKSNNKNTAHRKKKGGNMTVRRRYRGSGATASRQSAKTKDPMDELNTIDNEKKNMIVYKKMLSIEKLAPGTIGVDFKKDPATMSVKELKESLHVLGINTTQNEKSEIIKELKAAYLVVSNKKIDALLDKTIVKAREQIEKYLKEQEEKQRQINILKQKERELQEQQRSAEQHEKALRKEREYIAKKQAEIDKFNAEIKEFEEHEEARRFELGEYEYRYPQCSRCPHCSHCSHRPSYSHYSPKTQTVITEKVSDGVYIGKTTKYY
jgi:chromosome segregation ATPase